MDNLWLGGIGFLIGWTLRGWLEERTQRQIEEAGAHDPVSNKRRCAACRTGEYQPPGLSELDDEVA